MPPQVGVAKSIAAHGLNTQKLKKAQSENGKLKKPYFYQNFNYMSEQVTVHQIDARIQKKYADFYNKRYDGMLPDNLIETFKKAVMHIDITKFQIIPKGVKNMIEMPIDELTFFNVGFMLNIVMAVPFATIYDTLDEALEKHQKNVDIMKEYNAKVDTLNKQLKVERSTSMRLAGLDEKSAPFQFPVL